MRNQVRIVRIVMLLFMIRGVSEGYPRGIPGVSEGNPREILGKSKGNPRGIRGESEMSTSHPSKSRYLYPNSY